MAASFSSAAESLRRDRILSSKLYFDVPSFPKLHCFLTTLFGYSALPISQAGRVYILDMYNAGVYPFDSKAKRCIDLKVELVSGTKIKEYVDKLDEALEAKPSHNFFLCYY
ncbi:hypothetical protein MUK42_24770 [Musa troglodytarum]|uniref:Uncharacterized protein n=1 Tax=Musa troglodytarum TaxID=320322 RepID=A0A9E7GT22_9LILI|nr:hypothetical protein MUK42_24770 [Musa troglodytarum]